MHAMWKVNTATYGEIGLGEYCGKCFDEVDHDPPPRRRSGGSQGWNDNNPSFDNVVRCLEEDR